MKTMQDRDEDNWEHEKSVGDEYYRLVSWRIQNPKTGVCFLKQRVDG